MRNCSLAPDTLPDSPRHLEGYATTPTPLSTGCTRTVASEQIWAAMISMFTERRQDPYRHCGSWCGVAVEELGGAPVCGHGEA
jgi:hypothetical protein